MPEGLKIGDRLGDFEIVSVAGAGGMGVVYKARQRSLDRDVALKVIREEIVSEPEFRERFIREAKLAASVDHPHVVTVYDVGEEDGLLYLVMQWIDGSDLRQLLDRSGRLTPKRASAIGAQVAGALDAVHGVSGLVHRDVKPANVLLREVAGEDHAYLTDFGVAKASQAVEGLTRPGSTVGTAGYLSPEQIQGKPAGPRSDLYSLGCLVFEMMTGNPPFWGENEMALRWAHASDSRPLVSQVQPELGGRYDGFFTKALAIDPAQRFASGREFAEALTAARDGAGETSADATAILAEPRTPTKFGPPTAASPGISPPPAHPGSPYGYVTPAPPPPDRSGSPLALILLAIVAVVGIAVAALAAAGVFSNGTGTPTGRAVAHTPRRHQKARQSHPQPSLPADSSPCGSGLWVNSVTSCPFAENTRSAYAEANGSNQIQVYSPVTGVTYTMSCRGSSTVTCRGGNNAAVYFTSAQASGQNTSSPPPTPEPEPSSASTSSATQSCDENISANEVTSCPFAENVFVSYWEEYEQYGEQPESYVTAYSPTTDESYGMECLLQSDIVNCSGGNDAFVTFPMEAVRVYR